MIEHALRYASWGWRVFPTWWLNEAVRTPAGLLACGCGDMYCDSAGKHPLIKLGKGMVNASADPSFIKEWWTRWPSANVAVATGEQSGIAVVDLDLKTEEDGEMHLAMHLAVWGHDIPVTMAARTGSGGKHLFYRHEPGIRTVTGWLPGVDVRSDGGYVLLAPSMHETGNRYAWIEDSGIITEPGVLLEPLRGARSGATRGGVAGDLPTYDYREAVVQGPRAGFRDDFFNRRAFELRKQGIDKAEAIADLRRLWSMTEQKAGDEFTWEKVTAKLDRVWDEVQPDDLPSYDPLNGLSPAEIAAIGSGNGHDPGAGGGGERVTQGAAPDELLTDVGNASRLVRYFGADIRYAPDLGWHRWDGRVWASVDEGVVVELAKAACKRMRREAETLPTDQAQALAAWAFKSESHGRVTAMVKLASSDPRIRVTVNDLDPDANLLACANGVLDLTTGELGPHDRTLMQTRMSPVRYDPGARDSRWEAYLLQATAGDAELAAYIQRAAGYSLTAETFEQVFFMFYGPRSSGKSTFITTLKTILADAARTVQPDVLMHAQNKRAPEGELASMFGCRVVTTTEPDDGARFAASLVKQITGEDVIAARKLYKDSFNFRPRFKLWVATNHAPKAYDEALWDRIRLIPFPISLPYEQRDKTLKDDLEHPERAITEAAFAWIVAGCIAWRASGLGTCEAVERETAAYREVQDKLRQFLGDELEVTPFAVTKRVGDDRGDGSYELHRDDVYQRYTAWCLRQGERPMTQNQLGRKLSEALPGLEKRRVPGGYTWIGLRVGVERNAYGL